jgi:hypothetical protein
MVDLTAIRERMEVIGADGGHVGDVDHVLDQGEIQLSRRDAEAETEPGATPGHAHHHFIPLDWVERVDSNANRVELSLTKGEAERRWRHEG